MDLIPAIAPKSLASDTTFSNCLFIVDAYSKLPNLYGMDKITIEEVINTLDMLQSRFGTIYKFGCWNLESISTDSGM